VALGVSTDCSTAVRPWLATVLIRAAVTSPSTAGNQLPRAEPYAAAADCALAQASRVFALFRRPMSTISASVSRRIRSPRPAGTTGWTELSAAAARSSASGGGVHGT
jgi:hypothetical protein